MASFLLSPVGFDSLDVAHQILSKADPKDLKGEENTILAEEAGAEHELGTTQNREEQGGLLCSRAP